MPSSKPAPTRCQTVDAARQEGKTLLELIVEIIESHGPGGDEAQDGVVLILD
jgi:hypothetical protein